MNQTSHLNRFKTDNFSIPHVGLKKPSSTHANHFYLFLRERFHLKPNTTGCFIDFFAFSNFIMELR